MTNAMEQAPPPERLVRRSRAYCDYPFSSLYVATDGAVSPCCEYSGSVGNVQDESLLSIWTNEKTSAVRRQFEGDELPAACWKCSDREKRDGRSMRTERLDGVRATAVPFEVPSTPRGIDFRLSNLCNLRCRTCGPAASSKWHADGIAIGYKISDKAEIKSFSSVDDLFRQISEIIDGLETLNFAGGEPLLCEEHYAILEMLIAAGKTSVKLVYITNMTVLSFKGRNVLNLWAKFPTVVLGASVDAAGERGAIIRKDFDWAVFRSNIASIRSACPHVSLNFGITVSIFNMVTLTDLFESLRVECGATCSSFWTHPLQGPTFYRTQVLPKALKKEASRRIKKYKETSAFKTDPAWPDLVSRIDGLDTYMNAEDRSGELEMFREMTGRLDTIRSERLQSILPELSAIWTGPTHLYHRYKKNISSTFSRMTTGLGS